MKYETTFQSVIPRTPSITSFRFPRPAELDYKAGQYFFVTLRHQGKELIHHFSYSSSPTEKNHIEFTKRLSDSEYSDALRAAKAEDWVQIDGPYGKFTFEGEYPKIALLAGGIGITPFISICKNATDKGLSSQIVLFFSCRTPSDIPFREELEELARKNRNLKVNFTVNEATPDWTGLTGNINQDMIKKELPDYKDYVFYSCGPPAMVKAMQALIENLGLSKDRLKLEFFTGYT
ncbi:MAG: FAD-dependent oxidoreductase [Candidatus Bathyarchaeota archaeon]|nr:FAD-dependent oxidoreductase [Candidatus Bathyarchaeota archaeon]